MDFRQFFHNDDDFLAMDDLDIQNSLNGFGVLDSTVKSLSQLPAQNQNASPNKALKQDDIFEPFQHSRGTLDSNDLPNQASTVNSQTPVPGTQNTDSSMNTEYLAMIHAQLEDQTADISTVTKSNANNTMSDEAFEDVMNIIEEDQNVIDGVNVRQDVQEVSHDSVDDSKIPLPVHDMTQNNIQLQNSNVFTTMNTVNQCGGGQVAVNCASPNSSSNQRAISSPINQENFEGKCQFSQLINSKPMMSSTVVGEGNKAFQNNTIILNSDDLSNNSAAANPNVIHVTWQSSTDLQNTASSLYSQTPSSSKPKSGPQKRTGIVGRCPQGVLPLYLQPEPENEQEKRKWRRAITAHEHRESKKNTLTNDVNTIKELMKELNELRNKLSVVTVQRDTYKSSVDAILGNTPRFS